jgi:hypothetical protein
MKRKWTNETAQKYIELVEKGREPMGLKYLSAKDYLTNHKRLSKYSIIGI